MDWYPHNEIEKKWQQRWLEAESFHAEDFSDKPKRYILVEYPYPSGEGLHMGHVRSYSALDAMVRKSRMDGQNVLFPIGWDAFGLPTENYAIKTGIHPRVATDQNIANYRRQLRALGFSFDWSREVDTTDPKYYKWTQWIFLQLFKKGLAYQATMPINWCPKDKIGLANEEVIAGKCERCGTEVIRREQKQWMLKITAYAERLLYDLDTVDYLEKIKAQQRNWIGKSEGAEITFQLKSSKPNVHKVLLATNNQSKLERVRMLLAHVAPNIQIITPKEAGLEAIETEEGGDLTDNAIRKARAYAGATDLPILGTDMGFFLDGILCDPAKVKRNALDGEDEKEFSQDEIGEKMFRYYQHLAQKRGGKVDGYFLDVFALLSPDGTLHTSQSRRDLILTGEKHGEIDRYFPLRCLYIVKATNKYVADQTKDEEIELELAPYTKALLEILQPSITVFTTRPDTIFGATYIVLAPEHPLVQNIYSSAQKSSVEKYIAEIQKKSDLERTDLAKEKTGVWTGAYAINPANGENIPIWVADYVLPHYGTGAIMAVPAHDERDWEFAKKFGLQVKPVVLKKTDESYSFVMGVDEKELQTVGAKVVEKTKDGFFKITIPFAMLEKYKSFIREKMQPHFWNEFSTKTGFSFILKHQDGRIEELELNEKTNDVIDAYGEIFNDRKPSKIPKNVYSWLADNDFYQNLLIHQEEGVLINSGQFDGTPSTEAIAKITSWLAEKGVGKKAITYKLRDWIFSRQHYWGEPIPIIHCSEHGAVAVSDKELPVELPHVEKYQPTDSGESPLANIPEFVNTICPVCKKPAKRETDTMPNWAGSSWYYLRYCDSRNDHAFAEFEKLRYWLPVDLYNGGMEHTTLHLLYSRFWHKFLFDQKLVPEPEPYKRRVSHGFVLGEDGRKMSKSIGNVANPDDLIREYGADSIRVYEMFMGPYEDTIPWSTRGIIGVHRFLQNVYDLATQTTAPEHPKQCDLGFLTHKTIKRVTEDIDGMRFNTAVSLLMEFSNALRTADRADAYFPHALRTLLLLVYPMAPHLASELWERFGEQGDIANQKWPMFDAKKLVQATITLIVQVNGKVRAKLSVPRDTDEAEATRSALAEPNVAKYVPGELKKVVFVPGRLINLII